MPRRWNWRIWEISWSPVEWQLALAPLCPRNQNRKGCDTISLRSLCEGCDSKESCREKAFLGTPVILQERCVGVISLIAVTHEQQEHITDNLREFSDYVRHISTIFASKLLEDQGRGDNISKIFATMIDNMDQGVLVIDEDNRVQFVNQTALKTLGVAQNNMVGKPVRFRPLTFESNFTHGHMQHIVSWDDKSELIIGQLHNIQGRQLFLMAFHQSHTSFPWRMPLMNRILNN